MSNFKPEGRTPVLDDATMRSLGFTDHRPDYWYLCRRVDNNGHVTLNITIQKETGYYTELVMNEDFGQPEYYGRMKPEYRDLYRDTVDFHIDSLKKAGLTITVDHREYGCDDG